MSLGILSVYSAEKDTFIFNSEGLILGYILLFFVAPGTGIPALICHGIGRRLEHQAIDQFNNDEVNGLYIENNNYWSFDLSPNGIGFTYNF